MSANVKVVVTHHDDMTIEDHGISYLHCRRCVEQKPDGVSMREWGRLSVAKTEKGLQVYCTRHELNVDDMVLEAESVH